jgi:hypothetical protein
MRSMHRVVFLVVLGLGLLNIACASRPASPAEKDQLLQRAQTLWEAKVNSQWGTFYDLTTAEYRRHVTREEFLKSSFLKIESFEILSADIAPSGDTAKVSVAFKMYKDGFEFSPKIKDTWLREGGQWYYQPPMVPTGK